ncbi:hypothetical protein B296_00004167 [Ensete ventricosum]|uniref:Uncharacterized protein n=1 Tax=Ensete ventricosum TaxID=4639 RepID=A0A426YFE3_ENSVE|nr:hypothetical protein B296_00004167 [Ensete ventricosum]
MFFTTKAARRKGGQARLAPMPGRPPTARPWPRPLARGRLAAARASLQGAVALRGNSQHGRQPLAARRPPRGRLQGARKGLSPAASPATSRGGGAHRRGGHPLARRLPIKGSRPLRQGSGDAEGERGVWASFGEKDDPAPMNSKNSEDYPHIMTHGDVTIRGIDDVEINNHRAWRCVDAHIDPIVSD